MSRTDPGFWQRIRSLDEAEHKILEPFINPPAGLYGVEPDAGLATIEWDKYGTILDFACGAGRNLAYVLEHKRPDAEIYGYDFANMIGFAKEYLGEKSSEVIWVEFPIENLWKLNQKFDLVIASLIFQHLVPSFLKESLEFMRANVECVWVVSRGYSDVGFNMWSCLLDWFEPLTELHPEWGGETHQRALFKVRK